MNIFAEDEYFFDNKKAAFSSGFLVGVEGFERQRPTVAAAHRPRLSACKADEYFFDNKKPAFSSGFLVGVEGFEPPTLCL